MNVLFCCETVYQLIVATRIATKKHPHDKNDIIVFDTLVNADSLVNNIKRNAKLFRYVYLYKSAGLLKINKNRQRLISLMYHPTKINHEIYDVVYFTNFDWIINSIIHAFKRRNPNIEIRMMEDGFATYSYAYQFFFDKIRTSSGIMQEYYNKSYSEFFHVSGLYVFSPELMDWKPDFPMHQIEKISDDEYDFKDVINRLFNYSSIEDEYDREIVFFEESYFADGIDIGDEVVVDQIAKIVGKDNIMVKIHPRNKENRFEERGYKTNRNVEIPWEVIALNIDLSNKTLITIASGSALTSLINMKTKPKQIVMLMDCKEIEYERLTPTRDTLKKIANIHSSDVYLPNSIEELLSFFKKGTLE
ncbi:MAG: alpha-2,8-polysialyltransferase family protein [Clostridia bacterium]|nr:alpha-2,8-polysialyltransferase family protein [Clostridia bacterium]